MRYDFFHWSRTLGRNMSHKFKEQILSVFAYCTGFSWTVRVGGFPTTGASEGGIRYRKLLGKTSQSLRASGFCLSSIIIYIFLYFWYGLFATAHIWSNNYSLDKHCFINEDLPPSLHGCLESTRVRSSLWLWKSLRIWCPLPYVSFTKFEKKKTQRKV